MPIKMEKYTDTFFEHGIESFEDMGLLEEKHLEKMSIPLGHWLKIVKKIKETFKPKVAAAATETVKPKV